MPNTKVRTRLKIVVAAKEILAGKGKTGRIPQLWDGRSVERIVNILLREVPRQKCNVEIT